MVCLTLFLGSIQLAVFSFKFNGTIKEAITVFQKNVPNFSLSNGEIKVDGEMPQIFKENRIAIYIDTSKDTNLNVVNKYAKGLFIFKDAVINKKEFKTETYNLGKYQNLAFTKNDLLNFAWVLYLIIPGIFLAGLPLILIANLVAVLMLSVIALIANTFLGAKQSYGNLFKISIYASTLPIILTTLKNLANIAIPYYLILYYGIACAYVIVALKKIKNTN